MGICASNLASKDPSDIIFENVGTVRVAGHVGKWSGAMGVYHLNNSAIVKYKKCVYLYNDKSDGKKWYLFNATGAGWWIVDDENTVAGGGGGCITSTTASPTTVLGLQWKQYADSDFHLDPLLTVTAVTEMSAAELAAELAAAEAETQRILAIPAFRVAGHVGKQCHKMGFYALDSTHSPKRGKKVYSQEGASGVHLNCDNDGEWCICHTDCMLSGAGGGYICSTTGSPSPLGLQWKYGWSGSFHLDPLLTVTEMSAAELAAARAAAKAETQRILAIPALRVAGHVGLSSYAMGVYALDATQSPKRVYSYKGVVKASEMHLYLYNATDGKWFISSSADMVLERAAGLIASNTAFVSASPLGLQWMATDGTGMHLDPLLTVTEMNAAELATAVTEMNAAELEWEEAKAQRILAELPAKLAAAKANGTLIA